MTQINHQGFAKRSPRRKVLLVSENVNDLRDQAKLCEAEDFEALLCNSDDAAMRLVKREDFDLVVLHQGSPTLKGRDVLQCLSRWRPSTPFVLLTNPDNLASYLRAFAMTRRAAVERQKPPQPDPWRSPASLRDERATSTLPI